VLVEPVPHHFERLTALRGGDPRFTLLPFAVSHHPGKMTMYTVDPAENDPEWVSQLSSLHRHVIAGHDHLVPGLANRIREEQVEVVSLADVLDRAALPRVDLLHTDTEGHDAVILDQLDACGLRPAVIQYEHKHLSRADAQRCRRRLEQHGYRLTRDNVDTLAIRFWPRVASSRLRMRPSFVLALVGTFVWFGLGVLRRQRRRTARAKPGGTMEPGDVAQRPVTNAIGRRRVPAPR
jgi:FkbM family methyltransferase